jgi:hypothetical protein
MGNVSVIYSILYILFCTKLSHYVFMNDAATSQIYKIQVNNDYEPPFRGAGGQTLKYDN